jgi:dTDP-4-amino-4,6-dideoxygalactose transaminase
MLTLFRIASRTSDRHIASGELPLPRSPASICRLATGRSALLHLIGRLPRPHAKTVLLPCYVAEGVIQPFRVAEFTVLFYRLKADLTPETSDIENLLAQASGVAVVVLIHYFGFSARSTELDSLLERLRPVVVDDLAHAPFALARSGASLVENMQIVLYSLNKFLPVVDGAVLASNRPDIDVTTDEIALTELPQPAQQAYRAHLEAARDVFESGDPAQVRILLRQLESHYESYYSAINSDLRPFRQSEDSRRLEAATAYDELIERRSLNTRMLYDGLRRGPISLVHATLPPSVVPFCVPARVPPERRRAILDALFERGVLLSTLQAKWDFIPSHRRSEFRVESAFLDEHVLIPVSEFIAPESMQDMVAQLNGL